MRSAVKFLAHRISRKVVAFYIVPGLNRAKPGMYLAVLFYCPDKKCCVLLRAQVVPHRKFSNRLKRVESLSMIGYCDK